METDLGQLNRLNAKKVAAIREPGRYGDGGGLLLKVSPSGGKSWVFRWARDGKERMAGLGPVSDVSLEEARDLAREARRAVRAGRDPIADKKAAREREKAEAQRVLLFKDAAQACYEINEAQ